MTMLVFHMLMEQCIATMIQVFHEVMMKMILRPEYKVRVNLKRPLRRLLILLWPSDLPILVLWIAAFVSYSLYIASVQPLLNLVPDVKCPISDRELLYTPIEAQPCTNVEPAYYFIMVAMWAYRLDSSANVTGYPAVLPPFFISWSLRERNGLICNHRKKILALSMMTHHKNTT